MSDANQLYLEVTQGTRPAWWPAHLDRVSIKIQASPDDDAPSQYGPVEYDPNKKDLGKAGFINVLKNLCESIGKPFFGTIEIRVTRKKDGKWLHGWRGEVTIGQPRKRRGIDGEDVDELTSRNDRHAAKTQDAMLQMFQMSSQVISSSAAALNAMRGANAPPPWMQQQEGQPFWQELLMAVPGILSGAGLLPGGQAGAAVGQMAGQVLQHPVPRGSITGPGVTGAYPGQPMIPQQDLGYEAYNSVEKGDYDGFEPNSEDVLDDEFHAQEYSGAEAWDGESEGDEEQEEEEYEEEYIEPAPRRAAQIEDPLAGKSTAEVTSMIERWIDQHPNRGEVRHAALRLARKVM
jgi:hypothetical protein